MTHISASWASRIWFAVRNISPTKIEVWFDISIVEKAMPKMRPTYLARSPSRILRATLFMRAPVVRGESQDRQCRTPKGLWNAPRPCLPSPDLLQCVRRNHREDVYVVNSPREK